MTERLIIPEYDDADRAAAYGKRPRTGRAELRALARLAPAEVRGGTVLDLPAGNGRLAPFLREMGAARVLGVDGAEAMLREGISRYDAVAVGDAGAIPLGDRSVDAVFCVRLLHHFRERGDRRRILGELRRVSRGPVVFSVYRRGTLEGLRRRLRPKRPSGRFGIGLRELREDLAAAGLRLVRTAALTPLIREQSFVSAVRIT